ncbi:hypothetical protein EZV62_001285 [Acer yangbiense]|uniref:Zinc knuckle CX2CX4HX4C domain-containing protein n=1 Tax=Acer yangbiense TaxID=1000413 RepID=A0A5C7IW04_9ROSI|nr:hypothetical protein EZV62_001285 [Acer yangbiense]
MYNLPLECLSKDVRFLPGGLIGQVKEVDNEVSGNFLGWYLRVIIIVDVLKPLKRGLVVAIGDDGEECSVLLCYERLPNFCYCCGRIGHLAKEYELSSEVLLDAKGSGEVLGVVEVNNGVNLMGDVFANNIIVDEVTGTTSSMVKQDVCVIAREENVVVSSYSGELMGLEVGEGSSLKKKGWKRLARQKRVGVVGGCNTILRKRLLASDEELVS